MNPELTTPSTVAHSTPKAGMRPVPLTYVAVLVCFFFTFANVSCQGTRVASFTGFQLAFGTELKTTDMMGRAQTQTVKVEPLALFALIAGGLGLLLALGGRATKTLTAIAGVAGAVLLLLLKSKLENALTTRGQGMFELSLGFGYVLALILFALAAILAFSGDRGVHPIRDHDNVAVPDKIGG